MPLILVERANRDQPGEISRLNGGLATSNIPPDHWRWHQNSRWLLAVSAPSVCLPAAETQTFALDGFFSNTESLRSKLPLTPSATQSDLELLAALYQYHGPAALDWIAGNFLLLVLDERSDTAHIRRDVLGARAAFWLHGPRGRALASSSAILAAWRPGWAEETRVISNFFALRPHAHIGLSAFADIHEVLPGERLCWTAERSEHSRVPFDFGDFTSPRPTTDWIEAFDHALSASVAACTRSGGPIAAMLSGGLDSGPMVVKAGQILADPSSQLFPVSWVLPEHPQSDEGQWIELLCKSLQLRLNRFTGDCGLPFDEASLVEIDPTTPTQNPFRPLLTGCYQLATELGCGVILNGGMGDNLYPKRHSLLLDQWRRFGWRGLVAGLADLSHYRGWRGLMSDPALRHLPGRLRPAGLKRWAPAWLTPTARKLLLAPSERSWPPEASQYLHPDLARSVLAQRIVYPAALENLMANRHGLERRDPYQNEALVQLMLQMPVNLSFRQGSSKWIMRRAMAGQMPDSLRTKPRTGLMGSLFNHGFEHNRSRIRQYRFQENREWQRYVKPTFVAAALEPDSTSEQKKLVMSCLGYSLWRDYWEASA